jgi:hypothetical protein
MDDAEEADPVTSKVSLSAGDLVGVSRPTVRHATNDPRSRDDILPRRDLWIGDGLSRTGRTRKSERVRAHRSLIDGVTAQRASEGMPEMSPANEVSDLKSW